MRTSSIGADPFSDHAAVLEEGEDVVESTLIVGRNATLTLGTDAMIVLDEGLHDDAGFSCFGLFPQRSTSTRSIPYFNVLWASLSKDSLTVSYARPVGRKQLPVRVASLFYPIDDSTAVVEKAGRWVARLLDRAYGLSQRNKRIKLLINPYGGAGKAAKLYSSEIEPIFTAARCKVDVERTNYSGHAIDIAAGLDIDAYDVLASASGDGLPHQCFNGLARKANAAEALRKVAVVQLPCGTGNAMSWNLNGTGDCSMAALCIVKGIRTAMDLASVTQSGGRRTLSFLSQSLGIVAESDLGTEHVRWMGEARFTYGFLVRTLGKTLYPVDMAVKTEIDDKEDIKRHFAEQMARRSRGRWRDVPGVQSLTDLDGRLEASMGQGLPPLRYGTVEDQLPASSNDEDGWTPLEPYRNLGNFYCGNMAMMAADGPFFPASLPSDGLLDLMTVDGDIGRLKAINLMLSIPNMTFFDRETVRIRKITAVRVVPRFGQWADTAGARRKNLLGRVLDRIAGGNSEEGYFSIDGEKQPFEPFQIEVHPGLGTVLSRREGCYEVDGPRGWREYARKDSDGGAPSEDS